mgnify:CR=1 FL=1
MSTKHITENIKDINNLLFNNVEQIRKSIIYHDILNYDIEANKWIVNNEEFNNDLQQLLTNKDIELEFITAFIKQWILNKQPKEKVVSDGVSLKSYIIHYNFTKDDDIKIQNFIRIHYSSIHQKIHDRITQMKSLMKKIIDEAPIRKQQLEEAARQHYKNECSKAKYELIRQKAHLKNKTSLTVARELLKHIHPTIKEDDIRIIYDEFVNEWNRRHSQMKQPTTKPQTYTLKDTFTDRLKQFVVFNHDKLLNKDEFINIARGWGNTSLSLDEWYERYINMFYYQPSTSTTYQEPQQQNIIGFKSANKVKALKALYPEKTINESTTTSFFPLKQNIKRYQLHKVSKRHSYIIDLMFIDKLCYLVAININTRFLIVEVMNRILFDSSINEDENKDKLIKFSKYNKSAETFINTLNKIIQSGVIIKQLTFDGEGAFLSSLAKRYYRDHNIEWSTAQRLQMGSYPDFMKKEQQRVKTDPMHSSLGLIDRVIRTIRDMAYNMNVGTITPSIMKEIVNQYNNAPHKTLSLYAGVSVSPQMVQNDSKLETFIVKRIVEENYKIMNSDGFKLEKGSQVKLYNEKDSLMKRRSTVQPGRHTIKGFKNGLYEVKDDKNKTQMIPRYKIAYL